MRVQGQARFPGFWQCREDSAQMMREAIANEGLDRGILCHQEKPRYSPVVNMVIGAVILVLMLTGVAVGFWGAK